MIRATGQLNIRSLTTGMRWNESDVLTDRKSKFQARCCALKSQDEVESLLEALVDENKTIQKATHKHMYAWRTADLSFTESAGKSNSGTKRKKNAGSGTESTSKGAQVVKNLQQGSSDCGEAGAGQRLLTLLERSHVVNVLVIVTRWYGGTALGPARFRHISTTAVESLKNGGFLP